MLLYHGTSEHAALQALEKGLRPRKETGVGNWGDLLSNDESVYLTDTWACHYALNARQNGVRLVGPDGKIQNRVAVIEIDTNRLPFTNFRADEDFLAVREVYATKGGNLKASIQAHSKNLTAEWKTSLKYLGTCAYRGAIPKKAFTRIAFLDPKKNRDMVAAMADGTISPQGYKFAGAYHRAYTKWLFGDPVTAKEVLGLDSYPDGALEFEQPRIDYWEENILSNRQGVEIIELCKK